MTGVTCKHLYNQNYPTWEVTVERGKIVDGYRIKHCNEYFGGRKGLRDLADTHKLVAAIDSLFRCMQHFSIEYKEAERKGDSPRKEVAKAALLKDSAIASRISTFYKFEAEAASRLWTPLLEYSSQINLGNFHYGLPSLDSLNAAARESEIDSIDESNEGMVNPHAHPRWEDMPEYYASRQTGGERKRKVSERPISLNNSQRNVRQRLSDETSKEGIEGQEIVSGNIQTAPLQYCRYLSQQDVPMDQAQEPAGFPQLQSAYAPTAALSPAQDQTISPEMAHLSSSMGEMKNLVPSFFSGESFHLPLPFGNIRNII